MPHDAHVPFLDALWRQLLHFRAMHGHLDALRRFNRNVRLFFVASFLMGFCGPWGGIYGVLLNLYLGKVGLDIVDIGNVVGKFYLGMAIFALPAGWLVTRLGGRLCLALGLFLVAVGYALLPFGQYVSPGLQLSWFNVTLMASAGGMTLYAVNIWPYLTLATSPVERSHAFSFHLGLVPIGGILGGAVAGYLPAWFAGPASATATHYGYALWLAAGMFLPGVVALLAMSQTPSAEESPSAAAVVTGGRAADKAPLVIIGMMMVIMIFDVSGEGIGRVFTNKYMADALSLPTETIGWAFSAANLGAGIAVLSTPLIVARLGLSMTFILTTLGMSLSILLMGALTDWRAAGVGFAGLLGMSQMARAVKTQYAMEVVTVRWRGHMAGWMQFIETMTVSLLSIAGGHVIAGRGYAVLFVGVSLSTAVAAVIFYFFFHRVPRGEYVSVARDTAQNALPPAA